VVKDFERGGYMQKASAEPKGERYCLCCGKKIIVDAKRINSADETFGIKSYNKLNRQYGTLPWCRDCTFELFTQLCNVYRDRKRTLFYFCRIIDYPYITKAINAEDAETSPEKYIEAYMIAVRTTYSSRVKQGFLGGDYYSESDLPVEVEAEVVDGPIEFSSERSNDLFIKWGRNVKYSPEDYNDLEDTYKRIAEQNGIIIDDKTGNIADKVTEIAVIEAASYLLLARKARNRGDADDVKKYYDLYDKAMGSQLLRGKDIKDKQVGDVLVQDIVKYCESEEYIEPWDRKIKYPHKKDVVDQVLLHIMNYVGKLTADIFNKHVERLDKVPKEYKLNFKNDEMPTEETDFDKLFDKNMREIADFKARQHISDDDSDEDSADLDEDSDTDEALLGGDGD
jgi:hypothetical protein